jgi:membrane-associated protease RseP (regulator of RpoE activity)
MQEFSETISLKNHVVTVDYENGKVAVFDPSNFRADPQAIRVPVNIRGRIPAVEASVKFAGRTATGEFRIDTASGAAITLRYPFAEQNSFPPPGAATQSSQTAALGGSADWIKARATSVEIGPMRFDNPIVEAYATNRGAGGGTVLAGMIGNEILRRFRVTFDCPHKQMFFEPNSMRNKPFEADMSGLGFGPSFKIFSVAPGSVAKKVGLKVGDVITKLDGKPVAQFGLAGAHDQLMRDGAKCEVEVRRGQEIVHAILQLKRLL